MFLVQLVHTDMRTVITAMIERREINFHVINGFANLLILTLLGCMTLYAGVFCFLPFTFDGMS